MKEWFFPSTGMGAIEGYSNPGLETFKGEPIRAMAREICQNSLDAKRDESKPVRVEFKREFIKTQDFPGMTELKEVLHKCKEFWKDAGDEKAIRFINSALKELDEDKFFVFRISDFNTTGLKGAFDSSPITPWKGLVQGDAFSIKSNDNAAGSFGIGKAAPFVVSKLQTVFYRTYDETGIRAAQGVTHLVSFRDTSFSEPADVIRRSTGYYSDSNGNKPLPQIDLLESLYTRTEFGTDLFVPGFNFVAGSSSNWVDDIIIELLENFLYSIFAGKLEIIVDDRHINANNVDGYIKKYMLKTKNALAFYEVIRDDNEDVIEETKAFKNLGHLRLRLLYKPDLNKKLLIVRSSGMKIADISGLPRGISFTGFLELQGKELNAFFRGMENPQHNKWEPNRHKNPDLAKLYKLEVEEWVRTIISEKIQEITGDEIDVDLTGYFISSDKESGSEGEVKAENILDTVKEVTFTTIEPKSRTFNVKDIGGSEPSRNGTTVQGTIDDEGEMIGHRHRDGKRKHGNRTGRRGSITETGIDQIYAGKREVKVSARIIKREGQANKLIFVAMDNIMQGELEIVTVGENGKPLQLNVKSVKGITVDASLSNGHITVRNVKKNEKNTIEFEIYGTKNYAMGVRAYGDKE